MKHTAAKFCVVRNEGYRLCVGMIFDMGGEEGLYKVVMVNSSRARCEPVDKTREVTIKRKFAAEDEAQEVTFKAKRRPIDISPNSEVKVVGWDK